MKNADPAPSGAERPARDAGLPARLALRELDWIVPDWPASPNVRALMTTRNADAVDGVRRSMNLGRANGGHAESVERNRVLLREVVGVESLWLSQAHGIDVVTADDSAQFASADAAIAMRPGRAATVRVADCMPVLFARRDGAVVGAAHAGWRGLCAGVLEATVHAMRRADRADSPGDVGAAASANPAAATAFAAQAGGSRAAHDDIVAWMGPAIGPESFEVGDDVRDAFIARDPAASATFVAFPGRPGKWLADLYALARMRLRALGIESISGGNFCTVRDQDRFFSYRRDASGERMAALVWIEPA